MARHVLQYSYTMDGAVMTQPPFALTLYDEQGNIVVGGVASNCIPAEGTQLIVSELSLTGKFCWEVTGPAQVHFADPGSRAAREGAPQFVELRVKEGRGIHDS